MRIDDGDERIQLRPHRRLRAPVARRHRERHHLRNSSGIDPEPPRRRPLAQPLDPDRVPDLRVKLHLLHPPPSADAAQGFQLPDFYSGATDRIGRFTEGFLLRRLQAVMPSLGRQLRDARCASRLRVKDLARRANVSPAAIYNVERPQRSGRMQTLLRLLRTMGLKLHMPDFAALAKSQGLSVTKLALMTDLAFDTVRSLLECPTCGNVRTFEALCAALKYNPIIVV